MPGPTSLKSTCHKCGRIKWNIDFQEECPADISRTSICIACTHACKIDKLEKMFQEKDNEVNKMKLVIEKLEQRVKELEKTTEEKGNNGSDSSSMTGRVEAAPKSKRPHGDGEFKIASGRRVAKPRSMKNSFVTPTSNRFTILAEEEDDTLLIGDSMVRCQSLYFGAKNRGKRTVVSYPDAGTGKIAGELEKLKTKNRNTIVIAQTGGNDLFLKSGKAGETEPIMRELEAVANTLAGKTDRGIIVGLLPRLNSGKYALSKAIGINDRLKALCEKKGVQFLNPWDTFITDRGFFKKDGIHFSVKGAKMFGDVLSESVYRLLRYDFKGFPPPDNSGN